MDKRLLLMITSLSLALLVVAITLQFRPSPTQSRDDMPEVDPDRMPLPPDSLAVGGLDRPGAARKYAIETKTRKGNLIQILGETFDPLPQGRAKVSKPLARIHFSAGRLMEIRADAGTVYAPGNQPRSGDLRGNVIITYFDAPDGQPLDLNPASPHVAMRLFLEDARFDLELGQVDSDNSVHVTAPTFDFHGKGVTLTYNELRRRIDHLEVFTGKSLRMSNRPNSPTDDDGATTAGDPPPATTTPHEPATPEPTSVVQAPPTAGGSEGGLIDEGEEITYYRAKFFDDLTVRNPDMTTTGQVLTAVFTFAGRGSGSDPAQGGDADAGTPVADGAAPPVAAVPDAAAPGVGNPDGAAQPTDATNAEAGAGERSLMPAHETDIVVTWSGRLLVQPEEEKPSVVAGPRDAWLAITGQPVEVTTPNNERITAAGIEYTTASGQVTLVSDTTRSVIVDSAELGLLQAQRLTIDQIAGTGVVQGPGILRARDVQGDQPHGGLPPGMAVEWQGPLDLAFAKRSAASAEGAGALKLTGLRGATFNKAVKVAHPEMDVAADRLALRIGPTDAGQNQLQAIELSRDVRVVTVATPQQPSMVITSDELTVTMKPDAAGRAQPSRMLAKGNVQTHGAGRHLNAGQLDAELRSQGTGASEAAVEGLAAGEVEGAATVAAPPDAAGQASGVRLGKTVATESVSVILDNPLTRLAGDTVTLDPDTDTMVLSATGPELAKVQQPQGTLTGKNITLKQAQQTVDVVGAGTFVFLQRGEAAAEGANGGEPAKVGKPTVTTVTWTRSMHFDNERGAAQFAGEVLVDSKGDMDTGRLASDALALTFEPTERVMEGASDRGVGGAGQAPPVSRVAAEAAATGAAAADNRTMHRVQTLDAEKNVTFATEKWTDRIGGNLATRLTIKGPKLSFDRQKQTITVPGPNGSMLYEDYRQPPPQAGGGGAAGGAGGAGADDQAGVRFAGGRGQTLFTWNGSLIFDLLRNDMILQNQTAMIHKPAESKDIMQLRSQKLVADLGGAGGVDLWLSGGVASPKLSRVTADREVVVTTDVRTINTDHLIYSADSQSMLLRADEPNLTQVQVKGEDQPFTARALRWDLARNRLDVIDPGPTRMPVR